MSQINDIVGCSIKGSITAVVGSGITNMSDAFIGCQPRIDDPSNPNPSSKESSSSSCKGTLKCCHMPGKSMNLRSTITALFSFANSKTSFGSIHKLLFLASFN